MADQNLLNDDDFFAKKIPDNEEPKDKKEKVYAEEDDLFKPKNLDKQSAEELAYIESSLQERSDFDSQSNLKPENSANVHKSRPDPELNKPIQRTSPVDKVSNKKGDLNYKQVYFDMDEQQGGVSFKPLLITFLILIILGVGGYYLYTLYLKDKFFSKNTSIVEQPTEQTLPNDNATQPIDNQPKLSPIEKQKLEYLSKVASQTSQEVTSIGDVIAISRKTTKLSSVLLYDSDFLFEVFGKSMEDLAKLNLELKKSNNIQNLKIISSNQRLGQNGGILGVYSGQLAKKETADNKVSMSLTDNNEAENWLKKILVNNKLKVKNYKNRPTKSQDIFKVHEIEATANGSISSCINALNAIAGAGTNVRLYKLACTAVDQKNFGSANYQLKLVLKIYV